MEGLITSMTTAMSSIASDITSALTSIAPVAIPVIGIGLVVTLGVKFFKRIANKA